MDNAWDRAKQLSDKHASAGGIFVRLANDGDTVVGAFCGEPDSREVHWTGDMYADCSGSKCRHCTGKNRPSLRVSLNLWVVADNAMKVIQGGSMWFRDVLAVRDKYGLDKWTFEIKRVGKPKDPKTKYVILPDELIDDSTRKKIAGCPLHDLVEFGRGDAYELPEAAPVGTNVDETAAKALLDELRALPRAAVEEFFLTFRIARLRDLKATDLSEAQAYVAHLVGESAVPF